MTHDEEMWQDYDYHQNTGELPEYFDDDYDDASYCGDDDCGSGHGPDYVPVRSRCPRCGNMSAKMLDDGTYSCLYCSAHHYNGRLIKDTDDECADGYGTPLYCIRCGSENTEYYDNNAFHCLDCDCWTHPGAQCPKCGGLYMSFQGDEGWQCLSCGTTFTDEKSVNMIRFTCHMFDADHEDDVNQEALIRKYAHKRKPAKKPDKPKK